MRRIISLAVATWVGGCSAVFPTVNVEGHSLMQETWERDSKEILSRAAFELHCAQEALQLSILATYDSKSKFDVAKQVGVTGCGHRLVYVASHEAGGQVSWVLNSSDGEAK